MTIHVERILFNYSEAARSLCLSEQALRDLVYKGRGPKVTRMGRRVFFRPEDLKLFVDQLAQQS